MARRSYTLILLFVAVVLLIIVLSRRSFTSVSVDSQNLRDYAVNLMKNRFTGEQYVEPSPKRKSSGKTEIEMHVGKTGSSTAPTASPATTTTASTTPATSGAGQKIDYANSITKEQIMKDLADFKPVSDEFARKVIKDNHLGNYDIQPPTKFLKGYRSPCWYEGPDKQFLCLPYFLLAGFPKSATTDTWSRLKRHPQIATSAKEPHWWGRRSSKISSYLNKLSRAVDEDVNDVVLAEGSCSTIWDSTRTARLAEVNDELREVFRNVNLTTPHLIKMYNPDTKFIVMLRNPTERFYSGYVFFTNKEKLTRGGFLHRTEKTLELFNSCLRREGIDQIRRCVYNNTAPSKIDNSRNRLMIGLYAVYLSDLMKVFPRENILPINGDDYSNNMNETMRRMFDFLKIEKPSQSDMAAILEMDNKRTTTSKKEMLGPMHPKARKQLLDFYRPFNEALAELLNDPRYLKWNEE